MLKQDGDRTAFPVTPGDNTYFGLTVREYFVAAALQGVLANTSTSSLNDAQRARMAIAVADEAIRQL